MFIDLDQLPSSQAYFLTTQTLVPRPIAWVLSEHANGQHNLAPFSYFTAVSSDPPLLMLSIGRKPDGSPKDTLANIAEREHFVVHIAHTDLLEPLNASAASMDAGESEVSALGLQTEPFDGFALPRLSACRIAYACERYRIDHIGNQDQALVFGRIRALYLDDEIIELQENDRIKVDSHKLDPLARLGANEYLCGDRVVNLKRPD